MVSDDRRNLMKGMAAASGLAVLGTSGSAAASSDNPDVDLDGDEVDDLANFTDTIQWTGQGEPETLCCPANTQALWNWNLTGGGQRFVSASLTVTFDDNVTETYDAEFPGDGRLAQFDVTRNFEEAGCLTVTDAEATFTLEDEPTGAVQLVISSGFCVGVEPPEPPKPPKDKKKRRKYEKKYAKKRARRKYLIKKLRYEQRKENYEDAKKEYKDARRKYEKAKKNCEKND